MTATSGSQPAHFLLFAAQGTGFFIIAIAPFRPGAFKFRLYQLLKAVEGVLKVFAVANLHTNHA